MSSDFRGFSKDEIDQASYKTTSSFPKNHVGIRRQINSFSNNEATKKSFVSKTKPPTPDLLDTNTLSLKDDEICANSLKSTVYFEQVAPLPDAREESTQDYGKAMDENNPSPFKGISMKNFEQQQKVLVERNRESVKNIKAAIEKHSQKTVAEARKLEQIKKELEQLDDEFASNVAILRKQIELATIQYTEAQKRYNSVEQLFLKAKLDLYQTCEKKELLTEHLCTIITHNENRKANKLSELMDKVKLSNESQS